MKKKRRQIFALVSMAAVLTYGSMAWALDPPVVPQGTVECTGWHALCSLATDCKVVSDQQADCNCWRVNEQYIVVTADIKDEVVKAETLAACTSATPCNVDEAPVCLAIKNGTFTVEGIQYDWVSTYSYRGWCQKWKPVPCDAAPWADCMTSPCTENQDPIANPNRPLICQCSVNTTAFVGTNGGCKTKKRTIMSTINQALWDFENRKFTLPMPGYEYVQGACEHIHSDPVD